MIDGIHIRLALLERQVLSLRREQTRMDHWHNTVCSPLYKRLWWWAQGFRFSSLGRWYRAPWNESAAKYE
jgi:hypothetical protein